MHTVALKDTVEEVDWSHNTFGDLSEAREVLDDNDEDVREVVRQGAGRLLGLVVPAHLSKTLEENPSVEKEHLDAKGFEKEHIETT